MKLLRRPLILILCVCFFSLFFAGCSKKQAVPESEAATSVYSTFYPFYAATEPLLKGVSNVQLNCLVQPQDGCLRNYQLSDWDLALLSTADLIISGGRGLESFETVLYSLGDDGPVVASVLQNMSMTVQSGINTQEDSQSHWLDENPHIYLQIDAMAEITQRITDTLVLLNPENKDTYLKNLQNTKDELQELQAEIHEELNHIQGEKVIIMNEALVYAAAGYGLNAVLYYDRESGEGLDGADFQACLDSIENSDARVILIENQAPQAFCEALEAAGYHVARMDVLSNTCASKGFEGYLEAHRANVRAIKAAFSNYQ